MSSLLLLVGIPGSGKSTWAKEMFPGSTIVSSDAIREELSGDATNQDINREVFGLFHTRLRADLRKRYPEPTIADSTGLDRFARLNLNTIAREEGSPVNVVVFDNLEQAIMRNKRRDRVVPNDVMARMLMKHAHMKRDIVQEQYASVTVIESYG